MIRELKPVAWALTRVPRLRTAFQGALAVRGQLHRVPKWAWALSGLALLLLTLNWETNTGVLESRLFAQWAKGLTYYIQPGPTNGVVFPTGGPADVRRGYTRIPEFARTLKSLGIPGPRGGGEPARAPAQTTPPLRRWQDRLTGRQAPAGAHGELARLPGRHRHPQGKTAHHPRLSEQRSTRSHARPRRGVRFEPGALGMVRTGPISNDGPDPQRQDSRPAGARLEACPGSPLLRPGAEPLSHRGPGRSGTARRRVRNPPGARGDPRFRVRGARPRRPTLVRVALDHRPRPPYLAREQGRESDPDRPRA